MKENNRLNKKLFFAIGTIGLIAIILITVVIVLTSKPRTPKLEQLKNDFIAKELDIEEFSITDFVIETETDGKEDFYKAIVSVTYNNEKIEYLERHHFTYSKYDEWILKDIEEYEEDTWTKKPLVAPTIEDFEKKCISELYDDGQFTKYEKFEALDDKTEVKLDKGEVTFVFAVENNAAIQKVSGEIKFHVVFDEERGNWDVKDYTYMESYTIEHNLLQFWKGKGPHCGLHGTEIIEKDFTLKVTNFDNGTASGFLTYEGKQYSVSGKIVVPEEAGDDCRIDMFNTNEKMRIEGHIAIDGKMNVIVDTAYKPDSFLYYPRDRYNVKMFIED